MKNIPNYDIDFYRQFMDVGHRQVQENKEIQFDRLFEKIDILNSGYGRFFFHIADCSTGNHLYVSPECKDVTGYNAQHFMCSGLDAYIRMRHPESEKIMKTQVKETWKFIHQLPLNHRISAVCVFDYLIERGDNKNLVRILDHEIVLSLDKEGKVWIILGICYDTSHLKAPKIRSEPTVSIQLRKTRDHFVLNTLKNFWINLNSITNREKEILTAYGKNKKTAEIAETLYISPLTIQSHRSNLYRKTGCSKLAELRHLGARLFL